MNEALPRESTVVVAFVTPLHPYLKDSGYRMLTIDSYLAFYKVVRRTVQIHRVIHTARNINRLIDAFDQ